MLLHMRRQLPLMRATTRVFNGLSRHNQHQHQQIQFQNCIWKRSLSTSTPNSPTSSSSSSTDYPGSVPPGAAGGGVGAFPGHSHSTAGAQDEVSRLAALPLPVFTLKDLVRHGYPPLTPQALLASARYTRNLLPLRLARRILALRNLPFIIVSNPHISEIYNNYIHSLRLILSIPPNHPTTLQEEAVFTNILTEIVRTHANTIPKLAKGFIECRRYIGPEEVTAFLERHLRARIGTRLLAEQHVALREESVDKDGRVVERKGGGRWGGNKKGDRERDSDDDGKWGKEMEGRDSYIGTIDTQMLPARIITSCSAFVGGICELRYGIRPRIIIEGHTDAVFPYIPVHLEYIITELLKNAFRATIETPTLAGGEGGDFAMGNEGNGKRNGKGGKLLYEPDTAGDPSLPPVTVTIAVTSPHDSSGSSSGGGGKVLSIRIRDRGGGITQDVAEHIWKYSYSTFNADKASGSYTGASSTAPELDEGNPMNANLGMVGGGGVGDLVDVAVGGAGGGSIAGLGYGLPLSRAYAEYFGGSLSLQSCEGWGTDVYLTLRGEFGLL